MALPQGVIFLGALLGVHQAGIILAQTWERNGVYAAAEEEARASGKPFLVVGRPKGVHGCGDVALDIDPRVHLDCPLEGVVADVQAIPYPNGTFGAAGVFHVLEHLPDMESVARAWKELWRVADVVYVAAPSKWNLIAQWIPDHHLWVRQEGRALWVEEREPPYRRGWVTPTGTIMIWIPLEALP